MYASWDVVCLMVCAGVQLGTLHMIRALHLLFPIVPIWALFHYLVSCVHKSVVCNCLSIRGLLEPPPSHRLPKDSSVASRSHKNLPPLATMTMTVTGTTGTTTTMTTATAGTSTAGLPLPPEMPRVQFLLLSPYWDHAGEQPDF